MEIITQLKAKVRRAYLTKTPKVLNIKSIQHEYLLFNNKKIGLLNLLFLN